MRKVLLSPLILAAAASAGAHGQAAPDTLPCAAAVQAEGRSCDLDEILAANRTLEQVTAFWGEPRLDGPAGEMKIYFFPSGERLWLSFTDEGALARAILLSDDVVPRTRIVLNELAITRARRRSQLDLTRPLTRADVSRAWGPPDSLVGSGVDHWVYTMADGEIVTLVFDGDRLAGHGARPAGSPAPARLARGDRMRFNNSYAFALNDFHDARTGKPQPGDRLGGPSFLADPRSRDPATGRFRIDIPALLEGFARDGRLVFLGTTAASTFNAPAQSGLVAVAVDNAGAVQDYHVYRQSRYGTWAAKGFRATNQDASGHLLNDPMRADADFGAVGGDRLNYSTFVGFFYYLPPVTVGPEPRN
jgi:hypothetical protein